MKKYVMRAFFLLFMFPICVWSQAAIVQAEQLFTQKQYAKAEQVLSTHVSSSPKDLKGIELLGDAYGHQKKWDNAIELYKKLVFTQPNNANYHYKYGGALGMKALTVSKLSALTIIDDVKEAFLKAAELDPTHINTRWALVELYMQLPGIVGGSKSKSFKYAEELEQLSKVDGYLAKGYIYEYDNGGSLFCFNKLTTFYEKQKDPQKVLANLEATQQKHKRNALHYQIGKVAAEYNIELNKGEQCLHHYLKNYSGEDGVPKAWANYRLAQIYKHKGEKNKALEYIDKAITELPKVKPFQEERKTITGLR
jgi:tetratricopeptide (TPR) repeat protein